MSRGTGEWGPLSMANAREPLLEGGLDGGLRSNGQQGALAFAGSPSDLDDSARSTAPRTPCNEQRVTGQRYNVPRLCS